MTPMLRSMLVLVLVGLCVPLLAREQSTQWRPEALSDPVAEPAPTAAPPREGAVPIGEAQPVPVPVPGREGGREGGENAPFVPLPVPAPGSAPAPSPVVPPSPHTSNLPLVQPSNLVYQGSFRIPLAQTDTNPGFAYGGSAIGYNPAHDSLFMVGHDHKQWVGEVGIPPLGIGAVATWPTAPVLQMPTDALEGALGSPSAIPSKCNPADPNAQKIGGLLVASGRLVVSCWSYYDGAVTQRFSHLITGTDFSVLGDVRGPYALAAPRPGMVSGYMAPVPAVHQAALGGPFVSGQCCIAIVSRTSEGPALFAFDPLQLGRSNPVPVQPLVYYPYSPDFTESTALAKWGSTGNLFNGTTMISGVVLPDDTRSALFFGRQGLGRFCYGAGTSNQALDGRKDAAGETLCYDPSYQSKGTHAAPYVYQIWAYDVDDLAYARVGGIQPWDVRPYAVWQLTLPTPRTGAADVLSATYDPINKRIFLSQMLADGALPVVHVFTVEP